jgi:hypothetical protein
MPWSKVVFGPGSHQATHLAKLELQFDALFVAAGFPRDMALFAARDYLGGVTIYFSPVASEYAAEVINQYGGQPCSAPSADAVELVEGFTKSLERLCAGRGNRSPSQQVSRP